MRHAARRAISGPIAASLVLGGLLVGSVAVAAPVGAAAVTPCVATISPGPTVVLGTEQTLTVTGLTPNGAYGVTSTHNSSTVGPSPGTADATGGVSFTQTYALGTWTYAYHDDTSDANCSVPWTVIAETPTTTTTTVAPSAAVSPAATAVPVAPTFTG